LGPKNLFIVPALESLVCPSFCMRAKMASSSTCSVKPSGDGYMIPADDKDARQASPKRENRSFACCGGTSPKKGSSSPTMKYVGQTGFGDYIQETRYKYIGAGSGNFQLEGRWHLEEAKGCPCCLFLLGVVLLSVGLVSLKVVQVPQSVQQSGLQTLQQVPGGSSVLQQLMPSTTAAAAAFAATLAAPPPPPPKTTHRPAKAVRGASRGTAASPPTPDASGGSTTGGGGGKGGGGLAAAEAEAEAEVEVEAEAGASGRRPKELAPADQSTEQASSRSRQDRELVSLS